MPREFWRRLRMLLLCACAGLGSLEAVAVDFAFTGFGTAGYAISDEDFRYLRYIDNGGTLKADSLVGFQAEAQVNPQWGATVQAVASAPRTRDDGYEAKVRWAFLSFRPDNEWLFRVGRLRPPVFINTQNAEVGVTYDQARLPVEVYLLSPVYDVDGGAVTKTWALENAEINVDAYWGKSDVNIRLPFQHEPSARMLAQVFSVIPPEQYSPARITFMGLVLSHSSGPLFLRGSAHQARTKFNHPIPDTFTPTAVPAPPPFGGTLWLPLNSVDKIDITLLTFGADWRSGNWRITGEYGQRIVEGTKLSVESKSGYVTVARTIGNWTPYMTHARLLSGSDVRKLYQDINATPVPLGARGPPAFLPPNFHRILADNIFVYDQYSTMLGASYGFSATSKLKGEWMQTKVGLRSVLVDGDVHNRRFNVFTLAYSFAF